MKSEMKWTRVIYIICVIALIIGTIDPLEGSVLIMAGSALLALSAYVTCDRQTKIFSASLIMIVIGCFSCFIFHHLEDSEEHQCCLGGGVY
jgi:hypothetical protein